MLKALGRSAFFSTAMLLHAAACGSDAPPLVTGAPGMPEDAATYVDGSTAGADASGTAVVTDGGDARATHSRRMVLPPRTLRP